MSGITLLSSESPIYPFLAHYEQMSADTGFPLVFRIPDEILADVFLLNTNRAVEFWDRSRQDGGKDHDPGLTTRYSSQVCQRWREVALGHSTLWGRIIHYTEDPLPWIDELLLRTHQTTLELGQARELGQLAYPKLSVLSRVMCHAQRLKTVNMLVEQTTWQGICEGILQNRAPSLDSLGSRVGSEPWYRYSASIETRADHSTPNSMVTSTN